MRGRSRPARDVRLTDRHPLDSIAARRAARRLGALPGALVLRAVPSILCVAVLVASAPAAAQGHRHMRVNPTWNDNIGPLMADRCMGCHRPGQVARLSLLTLEEVLPELDRIRAAVEDRSMPPWPASPGHADFANDRSLSDHEISTIVEWIDNGTPVGRGAPDPPRFTDAGSAFVLDRELGAPDHVFRADAGLLIAAGRGDVLAEVLIPTGLGRDLRVRAVEVRGRADVLHDAEVSVLGPGGAYARTGRLVSAVPGRSWARYPRGWAKRLEAGSTLRVAVRYRSADAQVVDTPGVAVWLAPGPETHEVRATVIALELDGDGPGRAGHVFEGGATLTLLAPRMPDGTRDVTFRLVRPDGAADTLLHMARFDARWPIAYELSRPLAVTAGARLEVSALPARERGEVRSSMPGRPSERAVEAWIEYAVPIRR